MKYGHFIILLFIASCGLLKTSEGQFTITSTPSGAQVSVMDSRGEFKEIGVTPLSLKREDLQKEKQDFVALRVSKSGFVSETLFLESKNHFHLNYLAKLKAIDIWNDKDLEISSFAANKLAQRIQLVNLMIMSKKFEQALSSTEELIDQFPKAYTFYDIKGSILFLSGKKQEALSSFQKSLVINPDNREARKMIETIKESR